MLHDNLHRLTSYPAGTQQDHGVGSGIGSGLHLIRVETPAGRDHPDPDPRETDAPPKGFGGTRQTSKKPRSPPARSASAGRNTPFGNANPLPSGMAFTRHAAPETRKATSSTTKEKYYASTGIKPLGAQTNPPATFMNVPDVACRLTVLRNAISERRRKPLTPLVAEQWHHALISSLLLPKYSSIPNFLYNGALAGIPRILHSFTPPNKDSTEALSNIFTDIIQSEFDKGRYLGPFSQTELEREIGPFQSSPLSLIPKAGKPGKYRLIQNLSHPHSNNPTPSINSQLNSDDFPCTWGTFRTVCTLILNLPKGSQAATRDIAEAYRIIPLHESQWPGVVVRISNSPAQYALNTSNCFGRATAGGLFGLFGDALADLLRARGIGPILKWVDDFIFFRIPVDSIPTYNTTRRNIHQLIQQNGGTQQSKGRLWYKGKSLADVGPEHFAEDLTFPILHLRSYHDNNLTFPYGFKEINEVTDPLGVPWEMSKDTPFSSRVVFAGLSWDIEQKTVSLPPVKMEKYAAAIRVWLAHPTHTLEDTLQLHGKLSYACHVVPNGRAYLTNLEKMMGSNFLTHPFVPHHAPKHLKEDLTWWLSKLSQPSLSRRIPGNRPIFDLQASSDASSSVGIGIVIGQRWRAWRLLPGWKAAGRDIGWAEAVGMELLVHTILQEQEGPLPGIKVYGDNTGVIEGWWSGKSRNPETNRVFKRLHRLLEEHDSFLATEYVNTNQNPADGPSRGIYPLSGR